VTILSQIVKDLVRQRAGGCCEYCRCPEAFATQPHSIEHIRPRVQRGSDDPSNLALACQGCNNHKFDRTEAKDELTGEAVSLFHPREMSWDDHFAWSADYSEIIPLSAIGRVTVAMLYLNRSGASNLRRVLYTMGEHPRKR
jgi:hypothetical protein